MRTLLACAALCAATLAHADDGRQIVATYDGVELSEAHDPKCGPEGMAAYYGKQRGCWSFVRDDRAALVQFGDYKLEYPLRMFKLTDYGRRNVRAPR